MYGTQEEPRGKQYVTRAHTASCTWSRYSGPAKHARRRTHGTETIMASIGDSPNITCHCLGATSSMCRRHHVRICTCMGDASPTPCMWYMSRQRARRTFALITFLNVTDIYTYIDAPAARLVASLPARQLNFRYANENSHWR